MPRKRKAHTQVCTPGAGCDEGDSVLLSSTWTTGSRSGLLAADAAYTVIVSKWTVEHKAKFILTESHGNDAERRLLAILLLDLTGLVAASSPVASAVKHANAIILLHTGPRLPRPRLRGNTD